MEKQMKSYLNVLSQRRALYKLRAENLANEKSHISVGMLFDSLRDEIDTIITEISGLVKTDDDESMVIKTGYNPPPEESHLPETPPIAPPSKEG